MAEDKDKQNCESCNHWVRMHCRTAGTCDAHRGDWQVREPDDTCPKFTPRAEAPQNG